MTVTRTATPHTTTTATMTDGRESRQAPGLEGNVVDYLFEERQGADEAARPYLIMPGRDVSFGDMQRRVCQVGRLLQSLGVQPGDRVMFSVRDGIDFPALFLGAMKIGAVALPINTFLQSTDYAYYIRDSGARVLIVDHGLVAKIDPIRGDAAFPRDLFVVGGDATGYRRFEEEVEAEAGELATVPRQPDDTGFWLYSSGSTGDPKGVVHTHAHIYWATELFGIATLGMAATDTILCPPKMFFAFGLGIQVYFPLRTRAAVIIESEPAKPQALLDHLVRHRPTVLVGVPTLYAGMIDLMRSMDPAARRAAASRLRLCVSGGEVLPAAVNRNWKESTGTEILDGVGTTELTHIFMINRPGAVVPGSCGKLVDGYSARFLDEDGSELPAGEIGNLFIQGPTAAHSYWNKPKKTAATMWDGGVLTGDKCYCDGDGNFFYVGRVDDMLRVGGIWVSPAEVESVLTEHEGVLECAVIGVADENELIKPKAFVVPRGGQVVDAEFEESIRTLLRSRLAHSKCPRWIEFVAELPKTATGKIQRFRLRAAEARPESTHAPHAGAHGVHDR